jgi:hypothetical protein
MRIRLSIGSLMLLTSLSLGASFLAPCVQAVDQPVSASNSPAHEGEAATVVMSSPVENLDGIASGAVEDTLRTCLARIPVDATAGQRLLAEQGCKSEHKTKTLVSPTF